VAVLVIRLLPVPVGGGREWSVVTSVKPDCRTYIDVYYFRRRSREKRFYRPNVFASTWKCNFTSSHLLICFCLL